MFILKGFNRIFHIQGIRLQLIDHHHSHSLEETAVTVSLSADAVRAEDPQDQCNDQHYGKDKNKI